jgi:hypothetical protein
MDFDGVIHSYRSGWKGETIIDDPPTDGAIEFLYGALHYFRVAVFSSRSASSSGVAAMKAWLERYCREWTNGRMIDDWWLQLEWPTSKPSAFLSVDDRAITFTGVFPPMKELLSFRTWVELEREVRADRREDR